MPEPEGTAETAQRMKHFSFITIMLSFFCACSTGERTLSDQERDRLGLNGIAYDVEICPGSYDTRKQDLDFSRKCELVNCEPVNKKIVCKAKPENIKSAH